MVKKNQSNIGTESKPVRIHGKILKCSTDRYLRIDSRWWSHQARVDTMQRSIIYMGIPPLTIQHIKLPTVYFVNCSKSYQAKSKTSQKEIGKCVRVNITNNYSKDLDKSVFDSYGQNIHCG